jgi:hypothetical protein
MRFTIATVATVLVALGLWLISSGFLPSASEPSSSGPRIAATPRVTAGPVALGTALLAGGGLFFILLLRKR